MWFVLTAYVLFCVLLSDISCFVFLCSPCDCWTSTLKNIELSYNYLEGALVLLSLSSSLLFYFISVIPIYLCADLDVSDIPSQVSRPHCFCKCWCTPVFDTRLCVWSACLPNFTCQLQRFGNIVIRTTDEDFYFSHDHHIDVLLSTKILPCLFNACYST